jgi:hypothetical protein
MIGGVGKGRGEREKWTDGGRGEKAKEEEWRETSTD